MNWISNYVRPKLKAILERKDVPENLWTTCPECGVMINHRTMVRSLNVCPDCDAHMFMNPQLRFESLFDEKVFQAIKIEPPQTDPLRFKDTQSYPERLRKAQKSTKEEDAIALAEGKISDIDVVVAVQNFEFMAGSMGVYVGDAILQGCERCLETQSPFIIFTSAGGARMQEGILSLMQMPRTIVGVKQLKEKGIPYIVVLTHPTTGGVTASYAMLGDIHIAEPRALIGFAGPRVIEQTIKEKLPEGFQTSEYLLEHGMIDMVVHRKNIRDTLMVILRMLLKLPPAIRGELTHSSGAGKKVA